MSRRLIAAVALGAAALGVAAVPASARPCSLSCTVQSALGATCYKIYDPVNNVVHTICLPV